MDLGGNSFYLDFGFYSDGFGSIDRSGNFLFLRYGHYGDFGLHRFSFEIMIWFAFLKRFWTIGQISSRLLLDHQISPEIRFRLFFERAGGAFIKLGQILSLRHDLIPPRYANELLNLLSRVKVAPYAAMRRVFTEDIGAAPGAVFKQF